MEMIERVARELREMTKRNGGSFRGDDQSGWRDYVHDAEHLVEVMRSPTPEMVRAGEAWRDHCSDTDSLFEEMMKAARWPESQNSGS